MQRLHFHLGTPLQPEMDPNEALFLLARGQFPNPDLDIIELLRRGIHSSFLSRP
jgi:hypothetical protein